MITVPAENLLVKSARVVLLGACLLNLPMTVWQVEFSKAVGKPSVTVACDC